MNVWEKKTTRCEWCWVWMYMICNWPASLLSRVKVSKERAPPWKQKPNKPINNNNKKKKISDQKDGRERWTMKTRAQGFMTRIIYLLNNSTATFWLLHQGQKNTGSLNMIRVILEEGKMNTTFAWIGHPSFVTHLSGYLLLGLLAVGLGKHVQHRHKVFLKNKIRYGVRAEANACQLSIPFILSLSACTLSSLLSHTQTQRHTHTHPHLLSLVILPRLDTYSSASFGLGSGIFSPANLPWRYLHGHY